MTAMPLEGGALAERCEQLRSLHVRGRPLLLPNAWDVASARAVVSSGFPVVATTSAGVAATLGYEDHHGAPAGEMFAVAARIARGVDVPVTVDAEAGYGMEPAELVAALRGLGAAGCNLEDTDHERGPLREAQSHAAWLRSVREAADASGYPLVINARIDVFLGSIRPGSERPQADLLDDGLERAQAYLAADVDCVYPIGAWEADVIRTFASDAGGPVNVLATPRAPSLGELARLGAARVSWGGQLHRASVAGFSKQLRGLASSRSW
jgi:2-methylisocitrate lyase-like PEP mutase family enzyme